MKESGEQNNLPGMITESPTMRRRGNGNKRGPVKIFSNLFNEDIWLAADQKEMEGLVLKGVKEAIYLASEISALKGRDPRAYGRSTRRRRYFQGAS